VPGVPGGFIDQVKEHPPKIHSFAPALRIGFSAEQHRPNRGIGRDRAVTIGSDRGGKVQVRSWLELHLAAADLLTQERPVDPSPLDSCEMVDDSDE
jgi:hypothetical protein